MADEVEFHYLVQGKPDQAMQQWRADPPRAIEQGDFKLEDESYNSQADFGRR